ncbi:[FeFe] hydrogenase H-cluster maturation GTPase HydF [Ancylomarina longa]|uniref:[FeFe] hydrogenase H-cluster maturation GTPase HydF n=1 Tax=Ancylomarina longa TaxID=2487017 RepID=A0A434AYB2_9BACT|nr:[FeFe] hydrogenase H-cluster maturation GTPase HydF [Ancylomarina longa]RUT79429.1 [FeFe] hydrogenase H-cluster maturation GTPase HydF [Ancylomarina longa]
MPRERRPHIGIFGRRNNGKSTLINYLAGQDIAIVSDVAGTTTDPVKKSLEITGFGPVILIDTAGIDDTGELGKKRILKTTQAIKTIDLAILVITKNNYGTFEQSLIDQFKFYDIPFLFIHNKEDLEVLQVKTKSLLENQGSKQILRFSCQDANIEPIVQAIKTSIPESAFTTPSLLGGLISYGDIVLLITPIDVEAPEGRLILPQVQTIRDILDNDAVCIVLKEREVDGFLRNTGIKPKLVVTDSQVFLKADASIPSDIPLTSFSIMLAHFKGNFSAYLNGTPKISALRDGDKILLLESCTHHTSCDDIGRVKIPRWISNFTGKQLEFVVIAGLDEIPGAINDYALLIQCGGCMITPKQIKNRLQPAIDAGIAVTNYGMAIAYVQGIYERAVAPFAKIEDSSLDYL